MSTVYTSPVLEVLCDTLTKNIRETDTGIFSKNTIVTQSQGMNAWLKTELTERNGILVQTEFLNIDSLFSAVYKLVYNEPVKNNTSDIKYKLYSLLELDTFKNQFEDVSNYYVGNAKRRFDLAAKIADLFDQYQIFRPELLQLWENESGEELRYLKKGHSPDILNKLKKGYWVTQKSIDLHGLISEEAKSYIVNFISDCKKKKVRCIKIIHGKGLRSHNKEPVLRNKVKNWLIQKEEVIAYVEAPRHDGGSGAVLVLLKEY